MNKKEFSELLANPSKLSSQHIAQLEDVVKNFPYCQAAHILLARITHQSGSMLTEQKVKQAAAYALDRKKLKHFIIEKASVQEQKIIEETKISEVIQPKQEASVILPEKPVTKTTETISTPEEKKQTPKKADTSKEQFYKELQENLQKLHQLKKDTSKYKPGEKLKSDESKKEDLSKPVSTVTEYIPPLKTEPEKEKIEFKYDKPEEIIKEPVIPARYEDELASQEKENTSESGLLLEYLSYLDNKRQKRDRKKEEEIIEKFIKEDPSIPQLSPDKLPEQAEDLSEKSTKIAKSPVSENFARILLLQGKRDKALEIYEELILKYPEKRAYFAAKIEELKK